MIFEMTSSEDFCWSGKGIIARNNYRSPSPEMTAHLQFCQICVDAFNSCRAVLGEDGLPKIRDEREGEA